MDYEQFVWTLTRVLFKDSIKCPDDIIGFQNSVASCHFDSALFALLISMLYNDFVEDILLTQPNASTGSVVSDAKTEISNLVRVVRESGDNFNVMEQYLRSHASTTLDGLANVAGRQAIVTLLTNEIKLQELQSPNSTAKNFLESIKVLCGDRDAAVVRKQLQEIVDTMFFSRSEQSNFDCKNLGVLVGNCAGLNLNRQQDASEFLLALFQILNAYNEITINYRNSRGMQRTEVTPPVIPIYVDDLGDAGFALKTTKSFETENPTTKAPETLTETIEITLKSLAIFYVKRLTAMGDISAEKVKYNSTSIAIADNLSGLTFYACVCWGGMARQSKTGARQSKTGARQSKTGARKVSQKNPQIIDSSGHYVAYFKCPHSDNWYLYDDLSPQIKQVSRENAYETMRSHGLLFFYARQQT